MNEDKLIALLNSLDDDLVEEEIDKLLEGVEIDMDSIKEKAHDKLKGSRMKRRKRISYIAIACVIAIGMVGVYADDISQAIMSFVNKTPVYSTIVDGDAYYLKAPYALSKDIKLESVMVSEGRLEAELTTDLDLETAGIKIIPKNMPGTVYSPGGYSRDEGKQFLLFVNEAEENYNIKPFKDFELVIAGSSYNVSLEKSKSIDVSKEVFAANPKESNIKGVNVGAKTIDKDGKLGIQLIAAFDDKDLKLSKFGKPIQSKASNITEKTDNGIIASSGTSGKTEELYLSDESNNQYKLEIPKDAKSYPIAMFDTDAPKGKALTLKVPSIIASYEKNMAALSLDIPKDGEISLNKEIDLIAQKAIIKTIKRVSPTSAAIEVELNTGEDKDTSIRSFDLYSDDLKKVSSEFDGNKAIINLEFDKTLENTNVDISYPNFVMNGNWVIDLK